MRRRPGEIHVLDWLKLSDESPPTWYLGNAARWDTKQDWTGLPRERDSEDTQEVGAFTPPPAEASPKWRDGDRLSATDLRTAVLAHPPPVPDPAQDPNAALSSLELEGLSRFRSCQNLAYTVNAVAEDEFMALSRFLAEANTDEELRLLSLRYV